MLRIPQNTLVATWTILITAATIASGNTQPPAVRVGLDCIHNNEPTPHYTWQATDIGGYSMLGKLIHTLGGQTGRIEQPYTTQVLADYDVVLIADPDTEKETPQPEYISTPEIDALDSWVRNGGVLLLFGNNQGNAEFEHLNALANRFGIHFNNDTLPAAEPTFAPDWQWSAMSATNKVHIVGQCSLSVQPPARAVGLYADNTTPAPLVFAARARVGQGMVFAIGDPWFYNEYIDHADNRAAAEGLWRWIIHYCRSPRPARTILFIIDGLHWQAPDRLAMPTLNHLKSKGLYYRQAHLVAPYHPLTGDYARMHTTSIPNPVMLAGTMFIRPDQPLVQDVFYPEHTTVHATNDTAYRSLDRAFTHSMVKKATDAQAMTYALQMLSQYDVTFMRIHLQDVGSAGWQCHLTDKDVPWRRNIWADNSPYRQAVSKADTALADLVAHLKRLDQWQDTLLIVTSDHGEAPTGAHPPTFPDSSMTPLLITGPGVPHGMTADYAEHINLVPTICELMGFDPPNVDGGSGTPLPELTDKAHRAADMRTPPHPTRLLNEQLREYAQLTARMQLASPDNPALETEITRAESMFYSLPRFVDWHRAGTINDMLTTNEKVLQTLRAEWHAHAHRSASQ